MQIPARHGQDFERARLIGKRLRRLLGWGQVDPDAAEWQRLGEALMRGDPQMDAIVAWMGSELPGVGRKMFETALEAGIDAVPDAPDVLRVFFESVETPPNWVDERLLERGGQICRMCGNLGAYVLRDGALMGGYQAPGFNRVLVLTGALAKGPAKRLAETSEWWLACTEPGGLSRFGEGFKSTLRVRLIHALVRRHVPGATDWDEARDGVPVNQLDMAATQLAFGPAYLMGARAFGMMLSKEDGHAVMHTMRYAGYLMGIEEQFLPETEREGQLLLYRMLLSVVGQPDEAGYKLARSLADEPLGRHYRFMPALRRRFERERNLSVNVYFLGLAGMRNLNLPRRYVPWYPLMALPLYAMRSLACRFAPERFARNGRRAQREWVRSLTGATDHRVGGAVARHIAEAV
jgi:hypothetical protein